MEIEKSRKLPGVGWVVALVVAAFVFGPSGAAAASTLRTAPAAVPVVAPAAGSDTDFTPSGNKARKYMINVLGSMLGPMTPKSWQREMIANEYQYQHSWDDLNTRYGYSANSLNANGEMAPIPKAGSGSYDDVVIDAYEKQFARGGKGGVKMAAPAIKPNKVRQAVNKAGGAALALTALPIGFNFASGTMGIFGYDLNGDVCAMQPGLDQNLFSTLSGVDCGAWQMTEDAMGAANSDVQVGIVGQVVCQSSSDACVQIVGYGPLISPGNGKSYQMACSIRTGTPNPQRMYMWENRRFNGDLRSSTSAGPYSALGAPNACAGFAGAAPWAFIVVGGAEGTDNVEITRYGFTNNSNQGFETGESGVLEQMEADPVRSIVCSVVGSDGITYTAESEPYRDSDGSIAPAECPGLPDGVYPASAQLQEKVNGATTPLGDRADVTDEFAAWWAAYPECRGGACALDLKIKSAKPKLDSCFDLGIDCVGWFAEPDKNDKYQCTYGTHDVSLTECYAYSGLFEPGRIEAGAPYSDPMTGEWSGGSNTPSPDRQGFGQAVQNPDFGRSCNGLASTGFDPVAWVMRPVQCALEWAFVPRPAVLDVSMASVGAKWDGTMPGQLGAALGGWEFVAPPSGCAGILVDVFFLGDPFHILASCPGDVFAPVADWSRIFGNLSFAGAGIFAISRHVGRVFNVGGLGG